jgi:hypothetical protein
MYRSFPPILFLASSFLLAALAEVLIPFSVSQWTAGTEAD